jgi:hypothetical protein
MGTRPIKKGGGYRSFSGTTISKSAVVLLVHDVVGQLDEAGVECPGLLQTQLHL